MTGPWPTSLQGQQLRITLPDNSRIVLVHATVTGDSLRGDRVRPEGPLREAIAIGEIRSVEARHGTVWRPVEGPVPLPRDESVLRFTLGDGSQVELHNPRLAGDEVVGTNPHPSPTVPMVLATRDVRHLEVQTLNTGTSVLAGTGALALLAGLGLLIGIGIAAGKGGGI